MKPTIGRIVIYTLYQDGLIEPCRQNYGETELPAVIVRVWSDTCVNLKVLTDGSTDQWVTSVCYDASASPRTWRWPERA